MRSGCAARARGVHCHSWRCPLVVAHVGVGVMSSPGCWWLRSRQRSGLDRRAATAACTILRFRCPASYRLTATRSTALSSSRRRTCGTVNAAYPGQGSGKAAADRAGAVAAAGSGTRAEAAVPGRAGRRPAGDRRGLLVWRGAVRRVAGAGVEALRGAALPRSAAEAAALLATGGWSSKGCSVVVVGMAGSGWSGCLRTSR